MAPVASEMCGPWFQLVTPPPVTEVTPVALPVLTASLRRAVADQIAVGIRRKQTETALMRACRRPPRRATAVMAEGGFAPEDPAAEADLPGRPHGRKNQHSTVRYCGQRT